MELYLDYDRKTDIHGTVLYPAPMIAPLQFDVLKSVALQDELKILDPFHGSGVSLYEAAKLNPTFDIYGFDINPFANLITKTKLSGVNESIDDDITLLKQMLKDEDLAYEIHTFNNIDKWFKKDIIDKLSKIKHSISLIESKENRMFFWVIFSNVIRKFSNTRSSTYKLHVKSDDQIKNIKLNVIQVFLKEIEMSSVFYKNQIGNTITLKKTDSLTELSFYEDKYFDIIITSPPYGDNKTTVPYGQFSALALFWIDEEDLELDGWELDNYSIIDNSSMGGTRKSNMEFSVLQIELLNPYLLKIRSQSKINKVTKFFHDYFKFLDEIERVSNGYILLTLGNRTVDRIKIDLTSISKVYLEHKGYNCNDIITRELQRKRIPRTTSIVDQTNVGSINKEYLLIMQKKQNNLKDINC